MRHALSTILIARRSVRHGRRKSLTALCAVGLLVLAMPAEAQLRDAYWGVQAEFTPTWRGDGLDALFSADAMETTGSQFRIGFARGRARDGHWGLTFVSTSVDRGSFIDNAGHVRVAGDDFRVIGVSADRLTVFTTIRERAQIGMVIGAGVGTARGTIVSTLNGIPVDATAADFFQPFGRRIPVVPLARLELAVSAIVAEGLKIRASGGLNYPGITRFSVGAVYFFGER